MRLFDCSRAVLFALFAVVLVTSPAQADSGRTFYFALPGNSIGRYTGPAEEDNLRSVYHLVVERAHDPVTGAEQTGGPVPFTLQFLKNGQAYDYVYWDPATGNVLKDFGTDGTGSIVQSVDYGAPIAIELETFFDVDGPNGSEPPVLVSTNDDIDGGVQDGVFRLVSADGDVRLLLMNVDGPYIDPDAREYTGETGQPKNYDGHLSPDVTRLLPINNLGTEYTLNIDIPDRMVLNSQPKASVTVVATRDGTELNFVASPQMQESVDGAIGAPEPVTINRGEMWTMSADQYDLLLLGLEDGPNGPISDYYIDSGMNLFNGMKIQATKPVSVITAGGCAANRFSACDQTLLQLLPDRLMGTQYIVPLMPYELSDGFDIQIVAVDEVDDLEITIRVPHGDTSIDIQDPAGGAVGSWNSDRVQRFTLANSTEPMRAGEMWSVVWSPLPWAGSAYHSAERPGVDPRNKRLTLGVLPELNGESEAFVESWYEVLNLTPGASTVTLPIGSIPVNATLSNAVYSGIKSAVPGAQLVIESSSPVSVTVSPRPWTPAAGILARVPSQDGSMNQVSKTAGISAELIGSSTTSGSGVCNLYWDGRCADSSVFNGTTYSAGSLGYPADRYAYNPTGHYVEPVAIQLLPTKLSTAHSSISIPMNFAECYVGDPEPYSTITGDTVCGHDAEFSHFALLLVPGNYLINPNSSQQLLVKRTFNTAAGSGYPDDGDWRPLSRWWTADPFTEGASPDSVGLDFYYGFDSGSSHLWDTMCAESYFGTSPWSGGTYDFDAPQEFHSLSDRWRPVYGKYGQVTHYATYLKLKPFQSQELDELLWGDSASARRQRVFNPYIDVQGGGPDGLSDILPGDLVPDVPIVTYQFALGTVVWDSSGDEPVSVSVDTTATGTNGSGLMVYPVGTTYYGTYGYTGTIPHEPLPSDELVLVDEIPLTPGNSVVDASVTLEYFDGTGSQSVQSLVQGEDYEVFEASGGESVKLYLTLDPSDFAMYTANRAEVSYELELRDLASNTLRQVGSRTTLESYTASPSTGQATSSTMERGETEVPVGEGPIVLSINADASMYIPPSSDVQVTTSLGFNVGSGMLRTFIGSVSELQSDVHLLNQARAIDGTENGVDSFRVGTVMLDRNGSSALSPFFSSGTASFVIDAGRVVEWQEIRLNELSPQPEFADNPGVSLIGESLITLEVRSAAALSQIEEWRLVGEQNFVSITGAVDGDPNSDPDDGIVPIPAELIGNSRFIEVRITLNRHVHTVGLDSFFYSPVLESIAVGYTPSELTLQVHAVDAEGYEVLDLARYTGLDLTATVASPDLFYDSFLAGDLSVGDYELVAQVVDDSIGIVLAEARDSITIELGDNATGLLVGSVSTDRASYGVNDRVVIDSVIENVSPQYWDSEFSVEVEIYSFDPEDSNPPDYCVADPDGIDGLVYDSQAYRIRILESGQIDARQLSWLIGNDVAPGSYKVIQRFYTDSGASSGYLLGCAQSVFTVMGSAGSGALTGSIQYSLGELPPFDVSSLVRNIGNTPLTNAHIALVAENIDGGQGPVDVYKRPLPTPFGLSEQDTEMGQWSPTSSGTYILSLYAIAEELTPGIPSSNTSYDQDWITLDVVGVEIDGVSGTIDRPWFLAIELEPTDPLFASAIDDGLFRGGVNSRGTVVGHTVGTTADYASVWLGCQTPTDLHSLLSNAAALTNFGDNSFATDVSDEGTIVGVYQVGTTSNYAAYLYHDQANVIALEEEVPGTWDSVIASAVSSTGQFTSVVGWVEDATTGVTQAVIWRNVFQLDRTSSVVNMNSMLGLPDVVPLDSSSKLVDINDDGYAVGWLEEPNGTVHGYIVFPDDEDFVSTFGIDSTTSTDVKLYGITNELESLDGYYVLGAYVDSTSQEEVPFKAFVSHTGTPSDFVLFDMPTFAPPNTIVGGKPFAAAKGLGAIEYVGTLESTTDTHAIFWEGGMEVFDLNLSVLNNDSAETVSEMVWDLASAVDISSEASGFIVGTGELNSVSSAVKLERVPFENEFLDLIHFWVRSDIGIDLDGSGYAVGWNDITNGVSKASDADSGNDLVSTGNPILLSSGNCCDTRVVEIGAGAEMSVSGLLNDDGTSLSGAATFAIVFTPIAIDDVSDEVSVATLGTGTDRVEILYTREGVMKVRAGTEQVFANRVDLGMPTMLILRQLNAAEVQIWHNHEGPFGLGNGVQVNWDQVKLGDISGSTGTDMVGVAEAMLFEDAIALEEVDLIRDRMIDRYRVATPIATEDTVLWLRSDAGVELDDVQTDRVTTWMDQAGSWGDFGTDVANAPQFIDSAYGCVPALRFTGTEIIDGVGAIDVILLLDHSGSMNFPAGATLPDPMCDNGVDSDDPIWGKRFVFAQEAARQFGSVLLADGNLDNHSLGIISFDSVVEPIAQYQGQVTPLFTSSEDIATWRACYWSSDDDPSQQYASRPGGGTHLAAALEAARSELLTSTADRKAVLFLSDGGEDIDASGHAPPACWVDDGVIEDTAVWSFNQLFGDSFRGTEGNMYDTLFGVDTNNNSSDGNEIPGLRDLNIPVYTFGFDVGVASGTPDLDCDDYPASLTLEKISEFAGHGGLADSSVDHATIATDFLSIIGNLTGDVDAATLSLTFAADEATVNSTTPRVILHSGRVRGETANGLNVWIREGMLHVGAWWRGEGDSVEYDSISTPIFDESGLNQLIIRVSQDGLSLRVDGFLNGLRFVANTGPTPGSGGGGVGVVPNLNGTSVGGVHTQIGIDDAVRVESLRLDLGNLSVGAFDDGSNDEIRTDDGLESSNGFIGDIAELVVYDSRLAGEELEALFAWGISQYGAGILTRGYGPIALASGPGVGDDGVYDHDFDGVETVTLDASGTLDPDDTSDRLYFEWLINDQLIATGEIAEVTLPRGRHRVTLRVSDFAGHVSTDELRIDVHRVLHYIKPVDLSFDINPLSLPGEQLSASTVISPETQKLLQVSGPQPLYQTGRKAKSVDLAGEALLDLTNADSDLPAGSSPRTYSIWFETGVTDHDDPALLVQADRWGEPSFSITGNKRRVGFSVGEYTRGVEWSDPNDQLSVGWHHLAVVVPRGALWSDQIRMYLNGQLLATTTLDGSGAPVPFYTANERVYLGGNPTLDGGTKYHGGRIDEVQLFSGALSSSEVADLYNDVPVAGWSFESQSGSYAYASTAIVPTDLTTLILSSNVTINESGRLALGKKGSAQTAGAVFSAPRGNWTLAFKIRPELMTEELDPIISDSTGALLMLHADETTGVPLLYVATTGSSIPVPSLFDGNEHWITIVSCQNYPGFANGTYLFIDQEIDFTFSLTTSHTMLDGGPITIAGPNAFDSGFEGTIDDFQIYDHPLAESEILEIVD